MPVSLRQDEFDELAGPLTLEEIVERIDTDPRLRFHSDVLLDKAGPLIVSAFEAEDGDVMVILLYSRTAPDAGTWALFEYLRHTNHHAWPDQRSA